MRAIVVRRDIAGCDEAKPLIALEPETYIYKRREHILAQIILLTTQSVSSLADSHVDSHLQLSDMYLRIEHRLSGSTDRFNNFRRENCKIYWCSGFCIRLKLGRSKIVRLNFGLCPFDFSHFDRLILVVSPAAVFVHQLHRPWWLVSRTCFVSLKRPGHCAYI